MATITGTNGNDNGVSAPELIGTNDADTINGLDGQDVIEGLGGADIIDGGDGTDQVTYRNSAAGVVISLLTGTGAGGDAAGDTFTSIEDVQGSAFADTLTGDAGVNGLGGQGGNDIIEGGAGADIIDGGGSDSDTTSYSGSSAGVTVNLATFSGVGGDAEGDQIYHTENITGSAHADLLTGDGNANILGGGAGNDTLTGAGGNDILRGGAGDDTAVFSGTRANATITQSGAVITITSADGTDTLEAVEFLKFSDQTLSVESLFPSTSATIKVTTFADVVDANDGVTSLREAVTLANTDGRQTTIELGAGVYSLDLNDDLDITGDVIIRGAGASQTVLANKQFDRALNTHSGSTLALEGLTVTGTDARLDGGQFGPALYYGVHFGGALLNEGGNVAVNSVNFFDNKIASNFVSGSTSQKSGLYGSTEYKYSPKTGGAIFNTAGSMDIVDSAFTGNLAGLGGALGASGGYISVDATSFDGNKVYAVYQSQDSTGSKSANIASNGEGAAIYASGSARIDVFSDKAGTGMPTTIVNHTTVGGRVEEGRDTVSFIDGYVVEGNSLVDGKVYLDPAIVVTGNTVQGLDGVTRATPFGGPVASASSALSLALNVEAPVAAFAFEAPSAAGGPALLTLLSGLDLSLSNVDLLLVANAILSQSSSEVVVQLAGHRLVLSGDSLAYFGDPLSLLATSPDVAIAAAAGTISSITVTNADGTATVGAVTGLSTSFQSVVNGLAKPKADGTFAEYTDTLGIPLSQNGGAQNDTLAGTASVDFLSGQGGNDMLTGAGGNDDLDGGADQDTAAYTGARSDYVVFTATTGKTIVVDIVGARDGKDSILNVENFTFGTETVTLANALAEPADADNSAFQVYRFYNTQTGSHFFTTSLAERNSVIETLDAMSFEGNSFDSNVTDVNGTAVFRFFNFGNNAHFYTANAGEAAGLRQDSNFRDEGISYYASDDASNGGTELFRFFNTLNGTHFYTVSATERDNIISTLGHYNYEGTAFYVDVA